MFLTLTSSTYKARRYLALRLRYALILEATSIADWNTFLAAQAGAAATLTGLVFVAMSINLSRVLSTPGLVGRAAESLLQLFNALMVATCALIPRQPLAAVGLEVLGLGVLFWVIQTTFQVQYVRKRTGHPRYWLITRMIQTHFATVPFCIAGILVLRGSAAGLYWLAPGFMFSLFAGIVGAWVLLVEILR